MTVIGNPRSFHKKLKLVVEIDDAGRAGFQKASELSVEVANVQDFEGGSLIPNKSPGRLTFSDVTRGAARRKTATSSTGSRTSPSRRAASGAAGAASTSCSRTATVSPCAAGRSRARGR